MFKKIFKIALVLIALLFVAAIVFVYTFDLNRYKKAIEELATEELGAKVEVRGSLRLQLKPLPALQANSVTIQDKKSVFVFIRSLQINFDFDSLLALKVVPQYIVAREAYTKIACSAENKCTVNIDAAVLSGRLIWPVKNKRLWLKDVELKKAGVRYLNQASADTITMDSLSLQADDLHISLKAPFKLRKVLWAAGDFILPVFDYNGVILRSITASYKIERGNIRLDTRKELSLMGGYTGVKMDISFKKDTVQAKLSISSRNMETERLLRFFNQTPFISGRISVNINLTAVGASRGDLIANLNGRLKIAGDSLLLNGMNIDVLIDNYDKSQNFNLIDIGSVALFGPMGVVATKGTDFGKLIFTDLGERTSIDKLISDWCLQNGVAHCRDVAFRTPGHIIAMRGALDFVAFEYKDFTVAVVDEKGCAKIEQTLNGTLGGYGDPPGLIKTILGPYINLLKTVFKGKCDKFYEGSLLKKRALSN